MFLDVLGDYRGEKCNTEIEPAVLIAMFLRRLLHMAPDGLCDSKSTNSRAMIS
jgi:hypothetical protein